MNDSQNVTIGSLESEYSILTTDEAIDELSRRLGAIVNNLLRAAVLVKIIEDRGTNMDDLRERFGALLSHLRLIAYGQLEPQVVQRFYGKDDLIGRIATLPMPDQRRLANGDTVRVVIFSEDGRTLTNRSLDPSKLSKKAMARVFARGRIRDDAEQAAILDEQRIKSKQAIPQRVGKWEIDEELAVAKFLGKHGDICSLTDLESIVRLLRKRPAKP
jgi:hypothetical protein